MAQPRLNETILHSIPVNKKLKGYWRRKFVRIAIANGLHYAIERFKELEKALLRYRSYSAEKRANQYPSIMKEVRFRNNGMLRQLFERMLTQPQDVIALIKLYTGVLPEKVNREEHERRLVQTAAATMKRLQGVKSNPTVPRYLKAWLDLVLSSPKAIWREYQKALLNQSHIFHRLAKSHSHGEWKRYWVGWQLVLRRGWTRSVKNESKIPFPEVYKDYGSKSEWLSTPKGEEVPVEFLTSKSYEADVADLFSLHTVEESPLSREALDFVDSFLSEELNDTLQMAMWGDEEVQMGLYHNTTALSGCYVGHVQHIHKKGSGDDLRDIAVPNRFLQLALGEGAARLYGLLREFETDATFDQEKFDTYFTNRICNGFYVGSVDLSKATDNLPYQWGKEIISALCQKWPLDEGEASSLRLFDEMVQAPWEDNGFLVRWTVGQPLGSVPSFAVLGITHNLFVESLSAKTGMMHSPYRILGDDIVILNRKVRRTYVRELLSRGVPLSLHKSYAGQLTEFAGKVYIKGSTPFHKTDHNPIYLSSVLDYQRATGIRISWSDLPAKVRKEMTRLVRREIKSLGKMVNCPNWKLKGSYTELAREAYLLMTFSEVYERGSRPYHVSDSLAALMPKYFELRDKEPAMLPDSYGSGFTIIGGSAVRPIRHAVAERDGFYIRHQQVQLPEWFTRKFRPCEASAAFTAACGAVAYRDACKSEE